MYTFDIKMNWAFIVNFYNFRVKSGFIKYFLYTLIIQ